MGQGGHGPRWATARCLVPAASWELSRPLGAAAEGGLPPAGSSQRLALSASWVRGLWAHPVCPVPGPGEEGWWPPAARADPSCTGAGSGAGTP